MRCVAGAGIAVPKKGLGEGTVRVNVISPILLFGENEENGAVPCLNQRTIDETHRVIFSLFGV